MNTSLGFKALFLCSTNLKDIIETMDEIVQYQIIGTVHCQSILLKMNKKVAKFKSSKKLRNLEQEQEWTLYNFAIT